MCGVLRSAHHTLTNSSAEYQVLHAQYYKSRVVKRDFSVKNMADETEDSVVVVAGLLLAKKKKTKTKPLWKKSWRRRECMHYSASWRWVKIVTDSFESSAVRSGSRCCESPWQQVNKRLSSRLDWLLVRYRWHHTMCVLGSAQNTPHTTGFLVANIKHVHYLRSLLPTPSEQIW